MRITVKTSAPGEIRAELLAIPIAASASSGDGGKDAAGRGRRLPRRLLPLDRALGGIMANALASGDFSGRAGETLLLYPVTDAAVRRVLLVGSGKTAKLDREGLRRLAARSVSQLSEKGIERVALLAPVVRRLGAAESAASLTEGALLASYRFDGYRPKEAAKKRVRALSLVFEKLDDAAAVRRCVKRATIEAESQNLARELSNEPPNELPPRALASRARKVARETGLVCRVMTATELKRRKMEALLAVGAGSANPPVMIVLEHRGQARGSKAAAPICLVGKGITFDSGGLSLKPSPGMADMKHDMSGAATVVGAMRAIALQKLPLHVIGIIAAAENMPSGTAYRPGDIVRSAAGKTIEITNTDAEGRVVLADALHHACKNLGAEVAIDVATLTGAAMMAFGPWATAALGSDDDVIEQLRTAGDECGERVWPMPLLPEHKEMMRSSAADLRNASGAREAGISTAAAFLSEFVGNTSWVHLDIAGTGWTSKRTPYHRGGATGIGVRLLLQWLRQRASS